MMERADVRARNGYRPRKQTRARNGFRSALYSTLLNPGRASSLVPWSEAVGAGMAFRKRPRSLLGSSGGSGSGGGDVWVDDEGAFDDDDGDDDSYSTGVSWWQIVLGIVFGSTLLALAAYATVRKRVIQPRGDRARRGRREESARGRGRERMPPPRADCRHPLTLAMCPAGVPAGAGAKQERGLQLQGNHCTRHPGGPPWR